MGRKEINVVRPDFQEDGHVYTYQGKRMAGFSEIAKETGLISFDGIPAGNLNYSRDVGKAVHLAIRFHNEKRLILSSVSPIVKPYLDAYLDFEKSTGFQPLMIEEPMANVTFGYACTSDIIGTFRGQRSTLQDVELKTGAEADWHPIQREAQSACFKRQIGRRGIHLMPDGRWKPAIVEKSKQPYYRSVWFGAVQVYHFNHRKDENLWRP